MSLAAFGKSKPGFSAMELIIVIALFAITAAATAPFMGKFQQTETLDTYTDSIVHTLRRAQHRALTGRHDSAWGVSFQAGSYVMFAGNSYASRVAALDETHEVAESYTFSGSGAVVFSSVTGAAMTGAVIQITHASTGTDTILVQTSGRIAVE